MRAAYLIAAVAAVLCLSTVSATGHTVKDLTTKWLDAGADVDARLAFISDTSVWRVDMPGVDINGVYTGPDQIGNLLTRWYSMMDYTNIQTEIMTTSDISGLATVDITATGTWKHNGNEATIRCAHVFEWNLYTGKIISQTHYELDSQTAQVVYDTYMTNAQRFFVELVAAKTQSALLKNDDWTALLSDDFLFTTANVVPDAYSLSLDKTQMTELYKMGMGEVEWDNMNLDEGLKMKIGVFMVAMYQSAARIATPSPCGRPSLKYRFLPQYPEYPNTIGVEFVMRGQAMTALYSFNDAGVLTEEKIYLSRPNILERFIASDMMLRSKALTVGFEGMYSWEKEDTATN